MDSFDDIIRLMYIGMGAIFVILGVVFIVMTSLADEVRLPNMIGGFVLVGIGGGLVYFRLRRRNAES